MGFNSAFKGLMCWNNSHEANYSDSTMKVKETTQPITNHKRKHIDRR
jgi:hypothetical protein